jgi:hypothetical protein
MKQFQIKTLIDENVIETLISDMPLEANFDEDHFICDSNSQEDIQIE